MSTYRERREARAARLRDWAEKREAKSEGAHAQAHRIMDAIPSGQPILVGHHSEGRHRRDLDRMDNAMRSAFENDAKASGMRGRADNIEAAAAVAIYSDDEDAVERLTAKLGALEVKREAMKAANAAYRKAHRAELKEMSAYDRARAVPFPPYAVSNLGGVISTTRKRLAHMSAA